MSAYSMPMNSLVRPSPFLYICFLKPSLQRQIYPNCTPTPNSPLPKSIAGTDNSPTSQRLTSNEASYLFLSLLFLLLFICHFPLISPSLPSSFFSFLLNVYAADSPPPHHTHTHTHTPRPYPLLFGVFRFKKRNQVGNPIQEEERWWHFPLFPCVFPVLDPPLFLRVSWRPSPLLQHSERA